MCSRHLTLLTLIASILVMAIPLDIDVLAVRESSDAVLSTDASDVVGPAGRRNKKNTASPTATSISSTATGNSTHGGSTGPNGNGHGLDALFPIPNSVAKWTTFPGAPDALPLSDDTLKPFNVMSGTTHDYTSAPDGKQAMEANYPAGSYIPSKDPRGGFSFYAPGPDVVDFTTARELTFGYSIMFSEGFQFNKGGKLPGIYGGDDATTATTCSGGRRDPTCFSARVMWRPSGAGELYTYLPDPSDPAYEANAKICEMPNSECNPEYGASISRGAFSFPAGEWITVSERVKLNNAGQADGELELFVQGKSVISATGIILRDSDKGRMRGIQMQVRRRRGVLIEFGPRLILAVSSQTFFGGSTTEWASPVDQKVYFADFSVAIVAKL
ncbi:hypothetical protein C8R43DRAFT_71009 [Mycena crocata]|nr:hypothetical protein C8R43DRAFT_71009 [Mycena crocata]